MEPPKTQPPAPLQLSPFRQPEFPQPPLPPIALDAWHDRERSELVLVYLGGPSCGFCRDPEYQKLLIRFKDVVGRLAAERHVRLRTIGVSDDWDVDAGIDFLRGMGPWDEIVAGNSLYNSAVIEHIWSHDGVTAGFPQVVVFERRYKLAAKKLEILSKRYIVRLLGKSELERWLESAPPLDS